MKITEQKTVKFSSVEDVSPGTGRHKIPQLRAEGWEVISRSRSVVSDEWIAVLQREVERADIHPHPTAEAY